MGAPACRYLPCNKIRLRTWVAGSTVEQKVIWAGMFITTSGGGSGWTLSASALGSVQFLVYCSFHFRSRAFLFSSQAGGGALVAKARFGVL